MKTRRLILPLFLLLTILLLSLPARAQPSDSLVIVDEIEFAHGDMLNVQGDWLFLTDDYYRSITAIRRSNPDERYTLDPADLPPIKGHPLLVGDYLYLPLGEDGLAVVSIAEPSTMAVVNQVELPGELVSMERYGQYVYGAVSYSGTLVLNVSSPAAPEIVHYLPEPDLNYATTDALVDWDKLYLETVYAYRQFSLTQPDNPMLLNTWYGGEGGAVDMVIVDSLLVQGFSYEVASPLDVAIESGFNFQQLDSLHGLESWYYDLGDWFGEWITDMERHGDLAYVCHDSLEIWQFDHDDPHNSVMLQTPGRPEGRSKDTEIIGDTLFVVQQGWVRVFEIVQTAAPVAEWPHRLVPGRPEGMCTDVEINGDTLYVFDGDEVTLYQIVPFVGDVERVSNRLERYSTAAAGVEAVAMSAERDHFWGQDGAADGVRKDCRRIANVAFTQLVQLQTSTTVSQVWTVGDVLFVSKVDGETEMYDISDPAHPQYLDDWDAGNTVCAVLVHGTTMYVHARPQVLSTYDVNIPASPVQTSELNFGSTYGNGPREFYQHESTMYLVDAVRLNKLSISDPEHPVLEQHWSGFLTNGMSLTPAGDFIAYVEWTEQYGWPPDVTTEYFTTLCTLEMELIDQPYNLKRRQTPGNGLPVRGISYGDYQVLIRHNPNNPQFGDMPYTQLVISDVSDLMHPQPVIRISAGLRASRMALSDTLLFVGGEDSLEVFDLSDVTAPERAGVWMGGSDIMHLDGDLAIVASDTTVTLLRFGLDTSVREGVEGAVLPGEFALQPVYPNPFNAMATVTVDLPAVAELRVNVFNLLGERVAELVSGQVSAGTHEFVLDGSELASGVYFVRASAGAWQDVRKVALVK